MSLEKINLSDLNHHSTPLWLARSESSQIQAGIRKITPNNQLSVCNRAHMETISPQYAKIILQSREKHGRIEGQSAGRVLHVSDNCGRTENSYHNLKELSRTGKSKLIKAI